MIKASGIVFEKENDINAHWNVGKGIITLRNRNNNNYEQSKC